ncbi:hypothetical protein BSU00_09350 [Tenacibaculum sp. SG-28]|nr:hypothetical protein BSU00_09350 [Tenacibaculum sp. SG-28]
MLNYLDNTQNNSNNPNENYAREFLELFTILKGPQIGSGDYTNYKEIDVQRAAQVFTGIKTQADRSIVDEDTKLPKGRIALNRHDTSDKQFSSAFDHTIITGGTTEEAVKEELDAFVEMIFDKEATAVSFCKKLYRYFVKSEWDTEVEEQIIVPLAATLKSTNYEILPTLKRLLLSEHFFDESDANTQDEIIGSIVKSPLQLLSETLSFLAVEIPNPITDSTNFYSFFNFIHNSFLAAAGMNLWGPDSVAGYPAYYQEPDFDRHWFSSNTVLARYKMIDCLLSGRNRIGNNGRIPVALDLPSFVKENMSDPYDAIALITELSDYLYPESISESRKRYFSENLLEGFPDYYWTTAWVKYESDGDETVVKSRLNALLSRMINAPEFQLM